jgi:biotin carboxyl carrier protein
MAGLVVKVLLEDGAQVEAGQPVMVMEAMKMEVWIFFHGSFFKFRQT